MKTKTLFKIAAFVVAIPAVVLMANLIVYAFVGYGFLPEGQGEMNAARGVIIWLSTVGAVVLLVGANIASMSE